MMTKRDKKAKRRQAQNIRSPNRARFLDQEFFLPVPLEGGQNCEEEDCVDQPRTVAR